MLPDSLNDLTAAPGNDLREVPNTTAGTGEYWILYELQTGTVEGRVKDNNVCAGALATLTPGPSITFTGSSSPKQIRLDNQNWGNRWLLLDSVQITRIA